MRVVSLAAHDQSIGQTLSLVDNLPAGHGLLAIGLSPNRLSRRQRDASQVVGLAAGSDEPAAGRRARRPHLAQEAAARTAPGHLRLRRLVFQPAHLHEVARPVAHHLRRPLLHRRSDREPLGQGSGSVAELARERPLYAANAAYNLTLLAEVVRLGRQKGYAVTFFQQPLGPEASGPAWDAYLATYRHDVAGVARRLDVSDIAVQAQARLRATTSPICSTSSTRAATSGHPLGARSGGRSDTGRLGRAAVRAGLTRRG